MIDVPRKQRTIGQPITVEGFGYWSGRDIRVNFQPAGPDSGITFIRGDLQPCSRIAAIVENRVEAPRRTNLVDNGGAVEMVEHILAALAGLQVDNCDVVVDSNEMPGCDGSSAAFVAALDSASIVEQDAKRRQYFVTDVTRVSDGDAWVEARPTSKPVMSLECSIDYGAGTAIGVQSVELDVTPESFRSELAKARTFILKQEADWLVSQGLGTRATTADLLVFDEDGPIENAMRFPNECARHKALDLVGDLALAGCDLIGHFVAHRSGHRLNAELVHALLKRGAGKRELQKSA